jgi:hypothetical protein
MATQRITIAKIAGRAASVVRTRFAEWSAARTVRDPSLWSADQWPADCRRAVDAFAARLRAEAHVPPVVYFSEHVDLWSMGDLFDRYLPTGGDLRVVMGDEFVLTCYSLPDGGTLGSRLEDRSGQGAADEHPQEHHWFRARLSEAVRAWDPLCGEAVLVLLRQILEGSVTDEEMKQSLLRAPPWVELG